MKRDEMLLDESVHALRSDLPNDAEVAASAHRLSQRLSLDVSAVAQVGAAQVGAAQVGAIDSCADVQQLFPAYRAGLLSPDRSLLIQAHMRDCSVCHQRFSSGATARILDWSAPQPRRALAWQPRAAGWAIAATILLSASGLFVYQAFWQIPPGVRAEVQSIDGSAYRISNAGDRPLAPGDSLAEGDQIRTSGGAHAVLRLSDGSTVEVNERSVLGVGSRGRNTTVTLDGGDLIVTRLPRCRNRNCLLGRFRPQGIACCRIARHRGRLACRHRFSDPRRRPGFNH
jgi:hypothetical protein